MISLTIADKVTFIQPIPKLLLPFLVLVCFTFNICVKSLERHVGVEERLLKWEHGHKMERAQR